MQLLLDTHGIVLGCSSGCHPALHKSLQRKGKVQIRPPECQVATDLLQANAKKVYTVNHHFRNNICIMSATMQTPALLCKASEMSSMSKVQVLGPGYICTCQNTHTAMSACPPCAIPQRVGQCLQLCCAMVDYVHQVCNAQGC